MTVAHSFRIGLWCLALTGGLQPSGSTAGAADAWHFGDHPRLSHTVLPSQGNSQANTALLQRADNLLRTSLEVPTKSGQWIFYYACPKHNCSLQLRAGKHVCPICGKAYDDERTILAYETCRHDALNRDVLTLAQAWYVSHNDAYAREAWRVLQRYAELHPTWKRHDRWGRTGLLAVIGGKRYSQSLDDACGIIQMAQAYDLLFDWPGITPESRVRVEEDFFAATVKSIYFMYLAYDGRDNHMTWFNAAAATVGTVLGRADLVERAVNGSKGLRSQFANSVTAEGLWYEGATAYHFYALMAILDTVDAARGAGVDLTTEPVLKKLFLAPLELAYPNGQLPAINDSDRSSITGYRNLYSFATRTWPDEVFKAFAESGTLPKRPSCLYADAGLVYLRRGNGTNAVTAILDFGQHGGDHGHPDKLNLMLYALGKEVFLDPGRLTYSCPEYTSWSRQSIAHNTVVVDQTSQRPEAGTLSLFEAGDTFDIAVARANAIYPEVTLERALVLFDRVLIDLFRVTGDHPHTLDWILHGSATLTLGVPAMAAAPPLFNNNGYQHLTDLMQGWPTTDVTANWTLAANRFVRTHIVMESEDQIFTGNGIGYALTDRVPFLLVRRRAPSTIFAAIHDLSDNGSAVGAHALDRNDRGMSLTLSVEGHPCTVTWPDDEQKVIVKTTE